MGEQLEHELAGGDARAERSPMEAPLRRISPGAGDQSTSVRSALPARVLAHAAVRRRVGRDAGRAEGPSGALFGVPPLAKPPARLVGADEPL
ncbi:MAG TPA: hypothetical protein VFN50_08070, partial [Acidimicrobiales bacterium]|nr:hypothetical protein [Acidimicrobiales bacterium]